jgi:hypothetical protein
MLPRVPIGVAFLLAACAHARVQERASPLDRTASSWLPVVESWVRTLPKGTKACLAVGESTFDVLPPPVALRHDLERLGVRPHPACANSSRPAVTLVLGVPTWPSESTAQVRTRELTTGTCGADVQIIEITPTYLVREGVASRGETPPE